MVVALALVLEFALGALVPGAGAVAGAAEGRPRVTLSTSQAGSGGSVLVKGAGWRERALLMMLVCGRATPAGGVPGGTDSCANAEGRAVTADAEGAFRERLPVAEPPVPCPCVVHVATVTGRKASADAALQVAGHPVAPLPRARGGRLSVLTDTRLDGASGLLTWFGSPPTRRLVVTVGNVGSTPVRNPVFQVGTAHGVFAPSWEEQQWRGTIAPGRKARITLPVELPAGAHGDYLVSLRYGGQVLAEQPWDVGRPWGVTLFWVLLCLVVPVAVFRVGMAVVDRLRPARAPRRRPPGRHRAARLTDLVRRLRLPGGAATAGRPARDGTRPRTRTDPAPGALPWFTPDTAPSDHGPPTEGGP
ncbi:hypothetical protein [Streptomyces sp. G45]|uniref:hypothetical protein n=1 Tax=Streptomyces sp. G45 TaxID=3406627 RepID=UPI003C25B5C9